MISLNINLKSKEPNFTQMLAFTFRQKNRPDKKVLDKDFGLTWLEVIISAQVLQTSVTAHTNSVVDPFQIY